MKHADTRIDERELPVRANLKVIHRNDPDYAMTKDEIDDRNEFIRCHILRGFATLLMIPVQKFEREFFIENWEESAFNTEDFYRLYQPQPFNRYSYRIKKIMEQVRDLAILHGCVSCPQGRRRIQNRYSNLVALEFRNQALILIKRYRTNPDPEIKTELREKIGELNKRILQSKRIWEQYAPRDN
jgi:hypothetical protein